MQLGASGDDETKDRNMERRSINKTQWTPTATPSIRATCRRLSATCSLSPRNYGVVLGACGPEGFVLVPIP
jgi:hypothetical protein